MNMNMYSLPFRFTLTLLLAASCTLSLPAALPHDNAATATLQQDNTTSSTPLGGDSEGPVAEVTEQLGIAGYTNNAPGHTSPSAAQKIEVFRANQGNANTLFMVAMALQLHLEAGDPLYQSLVRKECNATVARLAPAASNTGCLLKYTCTYHQDRYPNFVVQADCQNPASLCQSCDSKDSASVKYCSRVSKRIRYLERSSTDGTWRLAPNGLAIGTDCRCI